MVGSIAKRVAVGALVDAQHASVRRACGLSKPPVIRGIIPTDGSLARVDMSVGGQLRQRAATGGERERAELAAFEALLSKHTRTRLSLKCGRKRRRTE